MLVCSALPLLAPLPHLEDGRVDDVVDVVDVDVVDDGDVDEDDDKDHEWPVQSQRGWACRTPAERSIICPS